VTLTGLVLGSALLPAASFSVPLAEDLDERKDKVEERIDEAHEHLDGSSAQLQKATDALLAAQGDLAQARSRLAATRGELAAAKALDRKMQAQLEAAIARLERARRELAAGKADVAEQEAHLRQLVVAAYEQGDPALVGLAMVLTTQDPAELASTMNSNSDVLNVSSTVLDQLEASKVLLQVKEEETQAAKEEVAVRRKAAAANLERKEQLERQARTHAAEVTTRVEARSRARSVALKARAADLAVLAGLESERDRIAGLLREKAAAEAAAAAAAAQGSGGGGASVDGGGFLSAPVAGYVTSPFGWRTHPIWGYRSLHDGVDFGAACGTPVRAAASGTVLETYFQSAWGNRVIIDHGVQKGVGVATISNHLQSFAVSPGQSVQRGQTIGYVGNTGWSTGCHLHYTVLQNGSPVDPMAWF
jgi:murein DD-endopeptidase MepM/ murein hydrolase activator NlpD